MTKYSLPFKVGILMALAVALISAAGYLTFKNLSSIVSSIEVKSRPDLRLITIRDIAADIDRAESSVRIYRLTRDQRVIKPYYSIIAGIDAKIDTLRTTGSNDSTMLAQIDTISSLIEENMIVWNDMIDLYHTDSLDIYMRTLTARIAVGSLNKSSSQKSILKRVFSRKAIEAEAKQEIVRDISRIEKQDSLKKSFLLTAESRLATTGNAIRERLYLIISRMENEVIGSIHENSKAAGHLASKTYQWLALFAFLVTLLVIAVVLVVVRYVIKTLEYQKALEQSKEETEQLARTKELFVANMSHEIRTPVNAIYGFAEQLRHEPMNDKGRKMLEIIRSTSEHLVKVVNDILDFSKLQHGNIELEKTHFQLQPIFEEVKMLLSKNAAANNSRLSYTISPDVSSVLFGDSHRLKQILLNLVGNAVKFTLDGEISYSAETDNPSAMVFNLILTIKDNGIGISKNMQTKVFEDFTQAEIATTRKYGGTGLGLPIVRKIVDVHLGKILLESEEGLGTKITCILPYRKGQVNQLKSSSQPIAIPEKYRKIRVLVVDDEDYNRMLFRTILTRWKLQFDEAEDGLIAIDLIRTIHYDLVFMDARMPGLDGMEAVSSIRNDLEISADILPIIGTSATHSVEDMTSYLSIGMNAFLPKPFTEKMLLDVMLSVLIKNNSASKPAITLPDPFPTEISGEGSHVDLSNIYHLANNDITFVKQLLNTFIESTEQGLKGLEDALHSEDIVSVHEIAHKISSPCRHLGAVNLYSQLKMIEEQAKIHKNMGILAKLSSDSTKEFQKIKEGLQKHLEKI